MRGDETANASSCHERQSSRVMLCGCVTVCAVCECVLTVAGVAAATAEAEEAAAVASHMYDNREKRDGVDDTVHLTCSSTGLPHEQ